MTTTLKAVRLTVGWSQTRLAYELRRLAERKQISVASAASLKTQISRWENGHVAPGFYQPLLCEVLKSTPSELGFTRSEFSSGSNDPNRAAEGEAILADVLSEVTLDDFTGLAISWDSGIAARGAKRTLARWNNPAIPAYRLIRVLTPQQVGIEEISQLEATVHAFRTWDHQFGGGMRRKAVVGQLSELTELLRHPHPRPLRRRLFSVAAQLAVVIGHMSGDNHRNGAAYRYLALAMSAARESGDSNLGARVANATSRQLLTDGHTADALSVLDHAQQALHELSDDKAALLLTTKAWAHAHAGAYDLMARSLDDANELLARYPTQGMFGAAELAGVSGACFEMLADRNDRKRISYARQAESNIQIASK